jgi:hypothetical protein
MRDDHDPPNLVVALAKPVPAANQSARVGIRAVSVSHRKLEYPWMIAGAELFVPVVLHIVVMDQGTEIPIHADELVGSARSSDEHFRIMEILDLTAAKKELLDRLREYLASSMSSSDRDAIKDELIRQNLEYIKQERQRYKSSNLELTKQRQAEGNTSESIPGVTRRQPP